MSDLTMGHLSTVFSACNDAAGNNPSQHEIETVLQPHLSHEAIDNASTDGRCDAVADRVRIHKKPLAQRHKPTFPARFEGQRIASKRAQPVNAIHRVNALGPTTHREGRDA